MDDRSAKRRRVSVTRSISISPIKIAANTGPIATRASPVRSPRRSLPTDSTQAGVATANLDTISPRGSLGLDGARDDVFDMMNIGKERRGTSRRSNPTPLRNTASNQGSPVSSVQASVGTAGETAAGRSIGGRAKRVSFAAAGGGLRETSVGIEEDPPEGSRNAGQEEDGTSPDADATMQDTEATPMDTNAEMTVEDEDEDEDGEPALPKLPTPDTPYGPPGLMSSSPSGQAARRLTSRRSMLPPAPAARRESVAVSEEKAPVNEDEEQTLEQGQDDVQGDGDIEQALDPEQDETELLPDDEDLEESSIPLLPKGPIIIRDVSSDAKRDALESLLRERKRLTEQVDFLEMVCIGMEDDEPDRAEARGILDIILEKQTQPGSASNEQQTTFSQRLASFLPFETRKKPDVPPETTVDANPDTADSTLLNDKVLNAFEPLSLRAEQKAVFFEDKHMEEFMIYISSPDDFLKLQLSVQIDSDNGRIFQVFHKGGSEWMKPELGRYLSQHNRGDGGPGTSDANTMGRAASCYWELASLRARTWKACTKDHSDLVIGIPNIENPESNDGAAERQALSLHLGRQALRLEKDGVGLLISWKIEFDCTGEVSSHVSACAAFPKSWRQRDDAQAFDHVGELFDLFLRKFGVRRAVTIMVELMFGKSD